MTVDQDNKIGFIEVHARRIAEELKLIRGSISSLVDVFGPPSDEENTVDEKPSLYTRCLINPRCTADPNSRYSWSLHTTIEYRNERIETLATISDNLLYDDEEKARSNACLIAKALNLDFVFAN